MYISGQSSRPDDPRNEKREEGSLRCSDDRIFRDGGQLRDS